MTIDDLSLDDLCEALAQQIARKVKARVVEILSQEFADVDTADEPERAAGVPRATDAAPVSIPASEEIPPFLPALSNAASIAPGTKPDLKLLSGGGPEPPKTPPPERPPKPVDNGMPDIPDWLRRKKAAA